MSLWKLCGSLYRKLGHETYRIGKSRISARRPCAWAEAQRAHLAVQQCRSAAIWHCHAAQVQWTGADDDIPQGHIGQVMGVKYVGSNDAWTWQLCEGPASPNGHSE